MLILAILVILSWRSKWSCGIYRCPRWPFDRTS